MANIPKAFHFERFVPNLGENRQMPPAEQLALELATGMSKTDLNAFTKAWRAAFALSAEAPAEETPEAAEVRESALLDSRSDSLGAGFGQFVKLERGGHTLDGMPINNLRDYLRALMDQPGGYALLELYREVRRLNSVDGTQALFSSALSGGSAGTADQGAPTKKSTH